MDILAKSALRANMSRRTASLSALRLACSNDTSLRNARILSTACFSGAVSVTMSASVRMELIQSGDGMSVC